MEGALLGAIEAVWQALLLALLWAFELVFALLQALQAASGRFPRAHLTSTSTSGSNSSDAKRSPAASTKPDAPRSQGAGAASLAVGDTVRCMAVVVAEDPACSMLQAGSTSVAAQLADIVQWCSEWGVEDLFLYDPAGQIKDGNAQLQRQLATSAALGLLQRPIHLQVGWGGHGPSPTVVEPSCSLDCGQAGVALETSTAATATAAAATILDGKLGTAGVDCQPPGEDDPGGAMLPESSVSSESAPAEAVAECGGGCWEEAGAKAGGSWQEAGAKLGHGCSSPAHAVSPGSRRDGQQDGAEECAGLYGGCDAFAIKQESKSSGCAAGVNCTAWQRHPEQREVPQQGKQPWHQEQHQHQQHQQQCQHQHQQGQQHEQRQQQQQQQQQQQKHLSHCMCDELLCKGESTQGQGLGTGIASYCQPRQAAEVAQTLEQTDGPCICHTGEAPATRPGGCTQGMDDTPGECRAAFTARNAKQHSDCGRTGCGIAAGSTGAAGATASALAALPIVAAAAGSTAAGGSHSAQGLRETMHGPLGGSSNGSRGSDVSQLAGGAAMRVYLLSARDAVEPVLDVAALRGGADSGPKPGSGPSLGGYERLRQPGRSYREAGAELYRQMAAVAGPAVGREPSIVLMYGPLLTLAGYPPFHTRGSEIYHMGRLRAASRAAVRAALGRFARTEQRCGR